jgi:hypothetical protein
MKKILIIIIFASISWMAKAVLSGSGTIGDPYYGSITTVIQWSNVAPHFASIYVGTSANNNLTIGSGGHLTIDPGITVIFTQLKSDLIITGSGILTAAGNSSNLITFTKVTGNSHWGHISFETPGTATPITGTGSFKYCHVEYGYAVTTGQLPDNGGGAIQVNAPNVTIENCSFTFNKSSYGGAVAINSNVNVSIKNCVFLSNNAPIAAGALLVRNGSASLVENCIFNQNTCDGAGASIYSGGAIWTYTNVTRFINNTFYLNTTKPTYTGDAFYAYNSPGSVFINSVFWGSGNQVGYTGASPAISYCAFQTVKPASATNSIVITGVATDHFTNPGGGDLSLLFISPCRDAGTTPTPAVPTDYLNKPRVFTYDIGAYEVQYSRWTGTTSTSWSVSTNWSSGVDPSTGTGDVIIPSGLSDYPIDPSNPGFTLGTGKQMIMNPGAKATLGNITNNGTLRLESDATGISSLITSGFSGNNAVVQLYLTGGEAGSVGSKLYKWHYISTPIATLPVSTFTPVTPDIVRYYDSRVTTDMVQGWVAQDGWIYASGSFGGPTFSNLTPGLGYDFYDSNNNTFTFSGQLNISDVPMTLVFSGGSNNGYNLLGNPFSSGLDWDYIISNGFPSNTSKSLYFTKDNALCSYIAGVGSPAGVNGYIPPMQGFFTYTRTAGNTINLAAAARTQSLHTRYKGTEIIPLIRLSLSDDTLSDETVVRFDEKALPGLDDDFDAVKLFYSNDNTALYSKINGIKYVINGQPYPDTFVEIPLVVNLKTAGNHAITTTQLQALPGYKIELIDNVTGFTADLRTVPGLYFSASAGSITDRFVLKVTNILTAIETPTASKNIFNIYQGFDFINIQTLADEWDGKTGSVKVFDLAGKTVSDISNAEFSKNSLLHVQSPSANGIYLVELRSGINRYVGKVVIR